jgi:DNA-binding transcriptional regulator GbsR (MarR family)
MKKAEVGPFTTIFGGTNAKILDQSLLLGNLEFTISTLAEATGLSYQTVQTSLKHFQNLKIVEPTRRLANAQAYHFNLHHIKKLIEAATEYQVGRP